MGYKLKRELSSLSLALHLGLEQKGSDVQIANVATSDDTDSNALSFSKSLEPMLFSGCIIVHEDVNRELINSNDNCTYLFSSNPRLDFIRAIEYLDSEVGFSTYDFDSFIHPSVVLGENVVIESGCSIDEGVVIEHNVVVHKGTTIGKNSRIRSSSSIGGDGFGFERLSDGTPIRFIHLGGVAIGQNVEIGSLVSIARGTLSNTIIDDYVKTDNLVHIAHNCHIESGVFITACAEISGGVHIGKNTWIGPNSSVLQKIDIGQESLVGIGAVVTKNVDAGYIYAGNPARRLRKS